MSPTEPVPADDTARCPTPPGDGEFRFTSPAEARAFAIVLELHRAGHFAWPEWASHLSDQVKAAAAIERDGGTPPTWPQQWLAALEQLLLDKQVVATEQLAARRFSIGAASATRLLRR